MWLEGFAWVAVKGTGDGELLKDSSGRLVISTKYEVVDRAICKACNLTLPEGSIPADLPWGTLAYRRVLIQFYKIREVPTGPCPY